MTPKELAEIRVLVNRLKKIDDDNIKTILGLNAQKLLEHIDSQAEEIERQATYVARLEAAYLEAKEESLFSSHLADDILQCEKRARDALEKMRGEKE